MRKVHSQFITFMPFFENPLNNNKKFQWNDELELHFKNNESQVANTTENTRYNPLLETSIKFNASRLVLGAALEQCSPTAWQTIAFTSRTSRFLNSKEEMDSVIELKHFGGILVCRIF